MLTAECFLKDISISTVWKYSVLWIYGRICILLVVLVRGHINMHSCTKVHRCAFYRCERNYQKVIYSCALNTTWQLNIQPPRSAKLHNHIYKTKRNYLSPSISGNEGLLKWVFRYVWYMVTSSGGRYGRRNWDNFAINRDWSSLSLLHMITKR